MGLSSIEDLETKLAQALRHYLAVEDNERKRERGHDLSNTVAWLTGALLKREEGWSRYWWVDDLLEDSIETVSPLAAEIHGDLIWGDGHNQWTLPFRGQVRLASPSDRVASYEFQVGDAATGLQKTAFGARQRRAPTPVTEWLFTLRGGPTWKSD
jgi:hypothetical protein